MLFKKRFFTDGENHGIVKAISQAEAMTSGEIRVHIEAKCNNENVLERATEVFHELKMDQTKDANGVLIYLAYEDRRFAILGDKGIDRVVPANFWDGTKEVMSGHFKKGEFYEGIIFAIQETGAHLKQYFPYQKDDKDELSNEISEG
jgi:uncharacterized membrane protein